MLLLIYCIDEEYKEILINQGLRLIKEEKLDGKVVYLFAQNGKVNFDKLDKTKVYQSNVMRFNG